MSDTEYDSSGHSDFSFQVGSDILNLLFLCHILIFSHFCWMLRFDCTTYLSLLLKFILSERLTLIWVTFIGVHFEVRGG